MQKITTLIFLFLLLPFAQGYSQTSLTKGNTNGSTTVSTIGGLRVKWKAKPFDHQVFIENKGQFDGLIQGHEKILYAAQLGNVWAYFTASGIVYRYAEFPKIEEAKDKDPDKDGAPKASIRYNSSYWVGANPSASIYATGERSDYYTYSDAKGGTIKTNIFNKIIYRNIYPGVDIEYTFPKGKDGFKYSIIVHPGTDVSQVTLKYKRSDKLKLNSNGDITFKSPVGEFTEHSPIGNYSGETGDLDISYKIVGSAETFHINGNYDKSKTIVIDPWVTDPLFANYDRAYDICYDYNGNVYAYGGVMPFQLEKFNSNGILQWTYTANPFITNSFYYGDFAVDRKTGTSYLTSGFWESGAQVLKINTLGNLLATYIGNPSINEMWRAVYNPCYDNIIIGAGGTTDSNQACMLDTNLVNITGIDFLHTPSYQHDIALICVDPSGLFCYMATVQTAGNVFVQLPLPTLNPATYVNPDHFNLLESNVAQYVAGNAYASGAMNGMAASPTWLYLYDGKSLKQYQKNTGILNDSIAASDSSEYWGGIDVDACDDIYMGCRDSVKYYNSSLALQGSIRMPNTVYCLTLGQGNLLYAGGNGFVTAIDVPSPAKLISSASGSPSSCSACDGKATVNINCGVMPFQYKWSNGNTNQTDTGMCAGIYSVKVTDGSCPPRIDSTLVIINGKQGYGAAVIDTNPGCGKYRGNITAYPYGGIPPYQYHWSNGGTNQEDTGLLAGTYICVIADNTGCDAFVSVTLVNAVPPIISVSPASDSLCKGASVQLALYGADSYTWLPPTGLSCNNCFNPIATPSVTTTYTIAGSTIEGCKDTITTTIKVLNTPHPIITGKDSVCSGYTDTLKASGGFTYKWSNGATTSSINYNAMATQTVTVTASNGVCSADTFFVIHTVSPVAKIMASADSTCAGDTILLTGSGGTRYRWSNGKTSSNIAVNPLTSQTYTLYAIEGTCSDSATVKIKITPRVTPVTSAIDSVICPNDSSHLTVTASGGPATYKWSNGATTSSITVSPAVTTTYTVTAYGVCDSSKRIVKVTVVPLPKPVITGPNWKCVNVKDTLRVSGGNTYKWSNGSTDSIYHTGLIKNDSIIFVTAYNSLGCAATTSDTILLRQPPKATANPPATFCAGQPITLTASATGSNQPFVYTWSTGQTGTSITIDPGPDSATTYTVHVSNGCVGNAATTAIPNVPVLSACCPQILTNLKDTAILWASGNSIKYKWEESPDKGTIMCLDSNCDTVRVIAPVTTTYTVIGTDSNGCQGEQLLVVDVDVPCFSLIIPNVFTPNNPGPLGLNNVFYIKTENVDGWSMTIYDRWGKEMFRSTNPNQYWDGTTEGGSKASDGVYYYIINATCQNTTYKKDGFIQLIR